MREYLFRGKRVSNKEWVEGSLLTTAFNSFIIPIYDEFIKYQEPISVDKDTVGQFTGLTDKNGVKIFEGDICKVLAELNYGFAGKHYEEQTGEVVFGGLGAFCIKIEYIKVPIMHFIDNHKSMVHNTSRIEVIGNIHDNSNLIQ